MSDARLRALYARGVQQRAAPDRSACAAPDRILAAVERRGAESERHATLEHVMSCPFCRADFDLLRAVADPPTRRPLLARRSTIASLGTLGALAAAAGIALLARGGPGSPPAEDVQRGAASASIALSPSGDVSADAPIVLTWRAVQGAVGYDAELLREDGSLLAALQTRDTTAAIADSLTAGAATYRWWVRARLRDGTSVTSPPLTFRRAAAR
ncbi:MAG TPA: hypothetical protein VKA84_22955 [Gemmatimonadaceae bacterium]|nr:hypothetical protein [Gemmatimonadaceae bacterium]